MRPLNVTEHAAIVHEQSVFHLTFFSSPDTLSRVLRTATPAAADAAAAQRAAKLRLLTGAASVASPSALLLAPGFGGGVVVNLDLVSCGGRFSKSISISSMPCVKGRHGECDQCVMLFARKILTAAASAAATTACIAWGAIMK
jgi:hypothetical protein